MAAYACYRSHKCSAVGVGSWRTNLSSPGRSVQCPYSSCSGGIEGPDELLVAYDGEFEHPVPHEQYQHISHTCAREADDGVVIVDVWQSRKDFQKMMDDPEFQKNLEAARWPTKLQLVEVYEVHASII
jgi:hypothetical protein